MDRKRLERTAYHEAGHAVVGYRFGHRFGEISIKPDKRRLGYCRFLCNLDNPEHRILVLLAGHAAQKAYDPDDKSDPSVTDYRQVWCLSEGMPTGAYLEMFSKADRLVSENMKHIQAIAEALMECETLDGGVWADIIDAVDKGEDWKQSPSWIVTKEFHG